MSLQLGGRITSHCDSRKMPELRDEHGNLAMYRTALPQLRRRKKQSPAARVEQDSGGERDVLRRALLSWGGQRVRNAEFPCLAEFRCRAEQTLRRLRRTKRRAKLHHGLVPVARRFGVQQRVRGFLQRLPALGIAQITGDGENPRQDARDVAIKHGVFRTVRDAQDCRGRVAADARKLKWVFLGGGEEWGIFGGG